jgi:phosphohistidine phosphatase
MDVGRGAPAARRRTTRPRAADLTMNILVIRHAIAEDRKRFARTGEEDGLRPLTREGRRRMRRAARGIARATPKIDLLATSPLTRAIQTGEIVATRFAGVPTVEVAQLGPSKHVQALLKWLQEQRHDATIALVGHEPQLSLFVSWMLTGLQEAFVPMKKGGACLLACDRDVKAGRAKLLWAMKPSQLRALGGSA